MNEKFRLVRGQVVNLQEDFAWIKTQEGLEVRLNGVPQESLRESQVVVAVGVPDGSAIDVKYLQNETAKETWSAFAAAPTTFATFVAVIIRNIGMTIMMFAPFLNMLVGILAFFHFLKPALKYSNGLRYTAAALCGLPISLALGLAIGGTSAAEISLIYGFPLAAYLLGIAVVSHSMARHETSAFAEIQRLLTAA